MLTINSFQSTNVEYVATYIKDSSTLIVTSELMDDDSEPYKESPLCAIWLNAQNMLCELECIFPQLISNGIYSKESDVLCKKELPVFNIQFEKRGLFLYHTDTYCEIVFSKEKVPDTKCVCSNLIIYISANQVVSIVCTNFRVVLSAAPMEIFN